METTTKIVGNESELNELFKESLDGIRDDLSEAQANVDLYYTAVNSETGGKEVYGSHYNDALRIKGQARERQLKFLNMFKDRVSKKETDQKNKKEDDTEKNVFNHFDLIEMVNTVRAQPSETLTAPINITPIRKVDFDEEDDDFDDE